MKITELQKNHHYIYYETWRDEVTKSTINIIEVRNIEHSEWNFYKMWGTIIECTTNTCNIMDNCWARAFDTTEFKEISEKQYSEILNKFKSIYQLTQKLME